MPSWKILINQHSTRLDGTERNAAKRICRPLRNHSATWPFGSPYMGLIVHGNSILTRAARSNHSPSQPGGEVARCDKGYNPPYQVGLGQERRVTLVRHHDDLNLVAS
jgi:hypothetical protein